MKTNNLPGLVAIALCLAALPWAGRAEDGPVAGSPSLPPAVAPAAATPAVPSAAPVRPDIVVAPQWSDIEHLPYDMRDQFFAGLGRLEARVDGQVGKLTAKRATMTGITHTQDWDFAMKEMESARSYLKSMGDELGQATPENWAQRKDKVGQAWLRTQDAYDKVKTSTTS